MRVILTILITGLFWAPSIKANEKDDNFRAIAAWSMAKAICDARAQGYADVENLHFQAKEIPLSFRWTLNKKYADKDFWGDCDKVLKLCLPQGKSESRFGMSFKEPIWKHNDNLWCVKGFRSEAHSDPNIHGKDCNQYFEEVLGEHLRSVSAKPYEGFVGGTDVTYESEFKYAARKKRMVNCQDSKGYNEAHEGLEGGGGKGRPGRKN